MTARKGLSTPDVGTVSQRISVATYEALVGHAEKRTRSVKDQAAHCVKVYELVLKYTDGVDYIDAIKELLETKKT